jgi:hypothetical protein
VYLKVPALAAFSPAPLGVGTIYKAASNGGRGARCSRCSSLREERLVGERLWLRFGAPQNLDASVNAKPIRLPEDTANVVVTAQAGQTVEGG